MWETDLAWNLVASLVSIECEGNGCQGILRLHLILCIEKIVGKDAFTVNLIGIGMSCSVHGPCCFVISAWILSNGAIATECPLYNFLYNLQSQHLVQETVYSWNISFHEIEDQHDWSFIHIVYTLWRYANSMTVSNLLASIYVCGSFLLSFDMQGGLTAIATPAVFSFQTAWVLLCLWGNGSLMTEE